MLYYNSDSVQKDIDIAIEVFEADLNEVNKSSEFCEDLISDSVSFTDTQIFQLQLNPIPPLL